MDLLFVLGLGELATLSVQGVGPLLQLLHLLPLLLHQLLTLGLLLLLLLPLGLHGHGGGRRANTDLKQHVTGTLLKTAPRGKSKSF